MRVIETVLPYPMQRADGTSELCCAFVGQSDDHSFMICNQKTSFILLSPCRIAREAHTAPTSMARIDAGLTSVHGLWLLGE